MDQQTKTSIGTAKINNNAYICRTCRLCKHDVAIFAYSEGSPYCPDCEKALSEIVMWWECGAKDKVK